MLHPRRAERLSENTRGVRSHIFKLSEGCIETNVNFDAILRLRPSTKVVPPDIQEDLVRARVS